MIEFTTSLIIAILTFFLIVILITYIKRFRRVNIFQRLRRHNVVEVKKRKDTVDLLELSYIFIKKLSKPFSILNLQSLDFKLKQAAIPLYGFEFIIAIVITSALFGLITYMLTLDNIITLMVMALVPMAFWISILILIKRRQQAFSEQLGDCLITTANALRAGYSFQQAISLIAKEMEPPISEEFSRVTTDLAMGINMENALEQMNKRVNSSDFELVVTAVLIQREVGGNLAQILDTISETINERIRMKREILALTAQGRFSAIVLLILPFVAGGYMYFFNHNSFTLLLEEPIGQIALVVSFVMVIIGFIIVRRMVDIDV